MDKITYLAELAEGLARWVPERERQDILRYYAEYFEEAGLEHESEVVAELGDPWALSCRLAVEGGYVTQEAANAWRPPQKKKKVWPVVLACSLAAAMVVGIFIIPAAVFMGRAVGRVVGRTVEYRAEPEVAVVDEAEFYGFAPVYQGDVVYDYSMDGFWNMEDGTLDPFGTIDVDVSLGSITICDGEDFSLFITQNGTLGGYSVDWKVENGVLKIWDEESSAPHVELTNMADPTYLFAGRTPDVTITVPQGFELDQITARTKMGDVYLGQLLVAGKVEVYTKMGDVECYEVCTANKIDLKTSMGDVSFGTDDFFGGEEIDLKTNMGNVEAQMGCLARECDYEAKTSMGSVTINGGSCGTKIQHKGDGTYKLEAESDMGDVNVYFYDDRW